MAGLSESGPDAFVLVSHERYEPTVPPWTIIDIEGVAITPHDQCDLAHLFPDGAAPDDLDPAVDGLRIIEAQRLSSVIVGGYAVLWSVTAEAISSRLLKRWPEDLPRSPSFRAAGEGVVDHL